MFLNLLQSYWAVEVERLTSAPATFRGPMEWVLYGLHWKSLLVYLDNLIVTASDFDTHLVWLEVFQRLYAAGFKLKPSKCEHLQSPERYLGYIVITDPEKVQALSSRYKYFLGTVEYYRQYIPDVATVTQPLYFLVNKESI